MYKAWFSVDSVKYEFPCVFVVGMKHENSIPDDRHTVNVSLKEM